jgi:hypothetical protein
MKWNWPFKFATIYTEEMREKTRIQFKCKWGEIGQICGICNAHPAGKLLFNCPAHLLQAQPIMK